MKYTYRSMATTAALVLAGGLALAGCQPNNSSSTSGASTQPGGAPSTGTSANGTSTTAAADSNPTAQSSGGSGGNGSGSGGSATCQPSDLNISLSGQNNVSGQIIQWIQLSNKTSKPCTMDGFAGVDLVGTADGKSGYDWPLERDSEHYSTVTLNPGEAAYFGIYYLPWSSGDGSKIDVTKIKLTPPNTTTTVTLPFSATILLQDAATHPGTYLTPIQLGRLN